jgi:SPP1 family phage portal protein
MAIYINKRELGDIENLDAKVLNKLIKSHQRALPRLNKLYDAYMGKNLPNIIDTDGKYSYVANYPRYIVNSLQGLYLGDPIRYTQNESEERPLTEGIQAKLIDGQVVRVNERLSKKEVDISPVLEQYKKQTISEADARIGQSLGIYGEAYEVVYTNSDPAPRSTVIDPRCGQMVRDDTVEHNPLLFLTYEQLTDLDGKAYYLISIYTDKTITTYKSMDKSFELLDKVKHFYGEVPVVEYENNSDRLGDFEPVMVPIDAYNLLMSNRVIDKNKFIDSILALYGASLGQGVYYDEETGEPIDMYRQLIEDKFIELPSEARIEYIQKTMNENDIHIMADDIIRDIHKMSMTVDMTSEAFAGNSSGQALKLKLLTMTMQAKNKMRQLEKGLKKRFRLYNNFLSIQGVMEKYDSNVIEPIFTLSIPIDESTTVSIVKQLQGIVDDEQLLSLLWFVKDPKKTLEKIKKQKEENKKNFMQNIENKKEDKEENKEEEIENNKEEREEEK